MEIGRSIQTQIAAHAVLTTSVHGWDASGDFVLGANRLKTTSIDLLEHSSDYLKVVVGGGTATRALMVNRLDASAYFSAGADGVTIRAYNSAGAYLACLARGAVGLEEVSRFQGAAAGAYFQATLPMMLLPIPTASLPSSPVEGLIAYDATLDRPVVYNGSVWLPLADATLARVASDTLRNSNDTERSTTAATYAKVKEVLLNAALAACRIKFTLQCQFTGHYSYAKIYKNGVAIGTERQLVGDGATEYSENFTGFALNDLIQIYAYSGLSGEWTKVTNMRFYYTYYLTSIKGDTLVTALEVTTDPTISMTNQDPV